MLPVFSRSKNVTTNEMMPIDFKCALNTFNQLIVIMRKGNRAFSTGSTQKGNIFSLYRLRFSRLTGSSFCSGTKMKVIKNQAMKQIIHEKELNF